jgi:tetratricopeptide (TPR) repeat protein
MPKAKFRTSSVQRISINGHFLDDTRTRLHSEAGSKSLSYLSAPTERHHAIEDAEGVTVRLPALTALQLFYDGVLTADSRAPLELTIAGRPLAAHYLHWMHALSGNEFRGPVLLRFGTKPSTKERAPEPNAWLKSVVPLKLVPQGNWDPAEEYWAEPGEPIEAWAIPIIKRGPRAMYEMEQVLPGVDPEDLDSDPIMEANDLKDSGKIARAKKLLEGLIVKDIRCLDAHAHLGNMAFERDARTALDHYRRGVLIGELSLGAGFDGVLSWRMIDNRPFLRCMSGLGLCLWRLEQFEEAEALFTRLLWMSPADNLGARFILPPLRARELWSPDDTS